MPLQDILNLVAGNIPGTRLYNDHQAQTQAMQAQAKAATLQAGQAEAQNAAAKDANGLSEGALNAGFTTPLSPDTASKRTWSDLSEPEQKHVASLFPSVKQPFQQAIPQAYDTWMARQYRVLPRMMFPGGMDKLMGGRGVASGQGQGGEQESPTGLAQEWLPEIGADGSVRFTPHDRTLGLSTRQVTAVEDDPDRGWAGFPGAQQEAGRALATSIAGARKDYQDRVTKDPAIQNYIYGTGEQPGIRNLWQDMHAVAAKYQDGQGRFDPTKQIDANTAKALVFKYGRLLNPGMGVRDWEFESLAQGTGVMDRLKQQIEKVSTGNAVPAPVLQGLLDVTDELKQTAQARFQQSLAGWEPELAQRHVRMEHVLHDPAALKEYRQNYGPLVPDPETAVKHLPPNTVAHLPDGTLIRTKGEQAPAPAPAPAGQGTGLALPRAAVQPPGPSSSASAFLTRAPAAPSLPNLAAPGLAALSPAIGAAQSRGQHLSARADQIAAQHRAQTVQETKALYDRLQQRGQKGFFMGQDEYNARYADLQKRLAQMTPEERKTVLEPPAPVQVAAPAAPAPSAIPPLSLPFLNSLAPLLFR